MPGRPTTFAYNRARPAVLAAGAGWLGYIFSSPEPKAHMVSLKDK